MIADVQLASLCLAKFGRPDELCLLLPSPTTARAARDFLADQTPSLTSRIVEFVICPSASSLPVASTSKTSTGIDIIELQILLFDKSCWPVAKSFWQHVGDGICSRMADRALALLGETPAGAPPTPTMSPGMKSPSFSRNRHYSRHPSQMATTPIEPSKPEENGHDEDTVEEESLTSELTTYLEERYGRNLPLFNAPLAKQALKRRIAGGLLPSDEGFGTVPQVERGVQGGKAVSEDDVYLYPTGMSAIWHAHDICRKSRRAKGQAEGKSVCYG